MISDLNIRINRDLCYVCGVCIDRCIMDNLRLSTAPCRQACPLDMNCQGYVRLIAQGKEEEAAQELRKYTPFAALLGRICSRPCEAACERDRKAGDGAVHIRALKRYLADRYPGITGSPPEPALDTGLSAAVVGSGPAGLMAAYQLRSSGHRVTVFEIEDQPGGLLRRAITSFRLPLPEVKSAVEYLEKMEVEFQTGQGLGRDLDIEELENFYGAIVLAVGAGEMVELAVPGGHLEGVVSGLDLLNRAKNGPRPELAGRSVVVIGCGNTAVDSALTCRRLGAADVRIVCLENPNQIPAYEDELREASEEGVIIENGWGVIALNRTSEGTFEVSLNRCLTALDRTGRFNPQMDETGPLHSLMADTVVVAIGQRVNRELLPPELFDPRTERLVGEALTHRSPYREKVFVCGDCLNGPSSVVEAMASGKEAAISADRFLRGLSLTYGRDYYAVNGLVNEYDVPELVVGGPRGEVDRLPAIERSLTRETNLTLTPEAAKREAERCLSCGRPFELNRTCWYCLPCEIDCPVQALEVRMPYQVR